MKPPKKGTVWVCPNCPSRVVTFLPSAQPMGHRCCPPPDEDGRPRAPLGYRPLVDRAELEEVEG